MLPSKEPEKEKVKITITDIVELNGRIYYIPDKYIDINSISYEHIKLFKFILASVIDSNLISNGKNISKLTKNNLTTYINSSNKIFSYIITGKLNIIQLSTIETNIINKLPPSVIPKLNPNIIERLE